MFKSFQLRDRTSIHKRRDTFKVDRDRVWQSGLKSKVRMRQVKTISSAAVAEGLRDMLRFLFYHQTFNIVTFKSFMAKRDIVEKN